jgi:DNA-binding transcriptional LysR family regulator
LYCAKGHPLFDCPASEVSTRLAHAEVVTSNYLRDKDSRNDGLNYQNSASAYHDEGIAHLILSGHFIGYLPEHFASSWVDKGLFKAILPERYHYQIPVELISSKANNNSPLAQASIELLKKVHGVY